MSTSTEQLKQILAGKPDEATHYSIHLYWKRLENLGWYFHKNGEWWQSNVLAIFSLDMRSLADIDEIVALREEVERLMTRVAQAEGAIRQTIGWVESTNSDFDAVRLLYDFMESDCDIGLNEIRAQAVAEFLEKSQIPSPAKAGCIGEFAVTTRQTCPQCWDEHSEDCDLCGGQSDENGICDLKVQVPWDTQKAIWKRMNSYALSELRNQKEGE